jgi:hypothetical protein
MMKNKLFCSLLFTLIIGSLLVSCKPEVEVFESSKKIANATLIGGVDSARSVCFVDGTTMKVIEYKFLPDYVATRTECVFGDGVYSTSSMKLSYEIEHAKNNVGLNIIFTPENVENEPFKVYFNEDAMIENGTDTIADKLLRYAKLESIVEKLPNTTWHYKDSTNWTDVIRVFDHLQIDTVLKPVMGIVNGRPGIVRVDTIFQTDSIFRDSIHVIGTKTYTHIEWNFARDEQSFSQKGSYSYEYSEYTKDSVKVDSASKLINKDFRWGLYTITTERRFGIRTISDDANKEVEDLAISQFMMPITNKVDTIKVDTVGYTMILGGKTKFELKK